MVTGTSKIIPGQMTNNYHMDSTEDGMFVAVCEYFGTSYRVSIYAFDVDSDQYILFQTINIILFC